MSFKPYDQPVIGVIGLGYVGLPLAVEFGKKYKTIGFDINSTRLHELESGIDKTLEVSSEQLKSSNLLSFTSDKEILKACNTFIVTVPTPVDKFNRPDLTPLVKASETVGFALEKGNVVIYESTVYPGVTEEECVPILERVSGLAFNVDFFAGYSPERINPGDKLHTVTKIRKVTSGSTPEAADYVDKLYASIIEAGTFKAASIKVAEAAKVIENSQRDINIAFVNELAKIFNKLDIDTQDVLEAAGTKWNFLPFRPGLVGGHCIGVDPYYLAQKAQAHGYHPEIILAGRRLNDGMGTYIGTELVRHLVHRDRKVKGAKVLVLGITFKENCPDVRNTRVVDVIATLKDFGMQVTICDPWASIEEVKHEYNLDICNEVPANEKFDAILLAVAHNEFRSLDIKSLKNGYSLVYDIKSFFPKEIVDVRL
ncbi:MAG: nucleotide sugar dehydrogenase [Chitinophagaceae bacterium]|nr:nucleotide sugar dehydrogenase [Chitinophagaceae bacterium]